MTKKMETRSDLDLDGDGKITAEETEIFDKHQRNVTMRNQSYIALAAMAVYPIICMVAPLSEEKLRTMSSISDLYFLSLGAVIAAAYGSDTITRIRGTKR
tara:strand:- start:478 stop:777 length:300 start_codon:yes stop_codon:yes gene_type:complete